MIGTMAHRLRSVVWRDVIRFLDSYASLLVLLIGNFFLLELVDDVRWGALGSTLLSSAALVVAISDPESGHHIQRRHLATIVVAVVLAPLALFVTSGFIVGLTYLLPVALLVTATLPATFSRVIQHRRVTHETVLGALCIYVLLGLLFAFAYIAVDELRDAPFFAQGGEACRVRDGCGAGAATAGACGQPARRSLKNFAEGCPGVKLLFTSVPQRLAERTRRDGFADPDVMFSSGAAMDGGHLEGVSHPDTFALVYIEVPDGVAALYETGENRYVIPRRVANAYWRQISACRGPREFLAHAERLRGSPVTAFRRS
jgi:hypothetical protein